MLKEIYEQPTCCSRRSAAASTATASTPTRPGPRPTAIDRVVLVAAGTASYAGMVGA
jgi:glucosamine 6-phosphate synthetase-like amidotransferase/phosphosugar isomerase protein